MARIIKIQQCQIYINMEYFKELFLLNFTKLFPKVFSFIRISHLNVLYLKYPYFRIVLDLQESCEDLYIVPTCHTPSLPY